MPLTATTLNIGAPSTDRARAQLRWIAAQDTDIWVLTETRGTDGTHLIADTLTRAGYTVVLPHHGPRDLGVLIASRIGGTPDPITAAMTTLPSRLAGIVIDTDRGPVRVLGAYVPSRDTTEAKTTRKRDWITALHTALTTTRDNKELLLLGDLNVLEPDHQPPHRGQFAPFEYALYTSLTTQHGLTDLYRHHHPHGTDHSWARRPELGYRYDHAHTTPTLTTESAHCTYDHTTRTPTSDNDTRLTDHSALTAVFTRNPTTGLLTSRPSLTTLLDTHTEPTLF